MAETPAPHVEMAGTTAPFFDEGMDGLDGAMDGPVYAEAEVILVEAQEAAAVARPDLRDVPLATPAADLAAARRTLGFSETPLDVWTPDAAVLEGMATLSDLDALEDWRTVERVIINPETLEATVAPIAGAAESDPTL
jgi:hypothetical protein